ncbi:hypothetical protein LOK49_LG07G01779 [Camellia lanceoleosa]|uniref:Uncharacterized protein n=1 Tax=Camellia lanceoleosa TaxID=1840588 RepID=A0ACC0H1H2_9ERIC|nr:hypothetical protein LOK49_LG07G01779 [Camellia lanceoleosa]
MCKVLYFRGGCHSSGWVGDSSGSSSTARDCPAGQSMACGFPTLSWPHACGNLGNSSGVAGCLVEETDSLECVHLISDLDERHPHLELGRQVCAWLDRDCCCEVRHTSSGC